MSDSQLTLKRELGLRDLILFNVAAVVSTRWIAVAAHIGPGSLVLWLFAAALFLVPSAAVVANLSRRFPEEGGLYVWTREAFGEGHAFACAWFYYVNNFFWIPGVLVSIIGMMMYAISPALGKLAERPEYVVPAAIVLLTVIVAFNYVGMGVAKWMDNVGGIGAYVIWGVLVISAAAALWSKGSATTFRLFTPFDLDKLNFWSQLAMAMAGLELSPILSGEIRNAQRTIFRATWISTLLIVLFYLLATSAIMILLPPDQVSPITGLAQAGQQASKILGWRWVPILIGMSLLLSVGGQLGTFVGGCARLPFVLGVSNLVPPIFAKLHPKYRTPYFSILFLGVGSGVLLLLSQLGETFRAAYQLTVDMTVISIFIPFLYIFSAAWKFGQPVPAFLGLLVSTIAISFSFLPTADVKSVFWFETKLIGGCILLFLLAWLSYRRYRRAGAVSAETVSLQRD